MSGDSRTRGSRQSGLPLKPSAKTSTSKKIYQLQSELARLKQRDRDWKLMFNMLTHDLKEPLVTLVGFTKMLRASTQLSAEDQRYVEVIQEAVDSLQVMVNSLQSIPKFYQDPKRIEDLSLNQLLSSVCLALSVQIRETQGEIHLPEKDLVIQGDPIPLYHVFLNLLANALKYHRPDIRPDIRVSYQQKDEWVLIEIQDNGVGIDQRDFEKIFTPYSRGDSVPKDGLGLGLSIVKKIIESLEGSISLESQPNQGTVFKIELPRDKPLLQDKHEEKAGDL